MSGKIEKLLSKINPKDRQWLLSLVEKIVAQDKKVLRIEKIKNTDFYRVRTGHFRLIFHYEKGEAIIDSIKIRNEKTYKQYH